MDLDAECVDMKPGAVDVDVDVQVVDKREGMAML